MRVKPQKGFRSIIQKRVCLNGSMMIFPSTFPDRRGAEAVRLLHRGQEDDRHGGHRGRAPFRIRSLQGEPGGFAQRGPRACRQEIRDQVSSLL